MKRTMAELGYIAGLLDRHLQYPGQRILSTIELAFSNEHTAAHVGSVLSAKVCRRKGKGRYPWVYVVAPSRDEAAEWLMTCFPLLSPMVKEFATYYIKTWRLRSRRYLCNTNCPHTDRPHYSKGKCKQCSRRDHYLKTNRVWNEHREVKLSNRPIGERIAEGTGI